MRVTLSRAAEKMTPEIVNFLMRVGAGYLCVAMRPEDCDRLDLTDRAKRNTSVWGTLTVFGGRPSPSWGGDWGEFFGRIPNHQTVG